MAEESTKTDGQSAKLDPVALNEQLLLSLVRQHELNDLLEAESNVRRKAEEALIRSEKLASVDRMAAVLAHEINNPLEAVTNLLFLAQSSDVLPEPVKSYLELADGELKRIAHITRQTLGFYRETASPTSFPLTTLFTSIVDLLQAKISSSHAVVKVQCDHTLMVTAFQGELRQVFSNLLRNSLDAVGEDGRVTLRGKLTYATGLLAPQNFDPTMGMGSANLTCRTSFSPSSSPRALWGTDWGSG